MEVFELSRPRPATSSRCRCAGSLDSAGSSSRPSAASWKRSIAELTEILENPEQLRTLVGNQLAEIAQQHGTPRRTILLAASGVAATAASAPLEVADDPCWVLLSSAGLLARTNHAQPLPPAATRANHDLIVSKIISTARGECGLITSAGRLIKISALDLPTVPITAHAPNLQGALTSVSW